MVKTSTIKHIFIGIPFCVTVFVYFFEKYRSLEQRSEGLGPEAADRYTLFFRDREKENKTK